MNKPDLHSFHIPVLGLGYSIDTPLKVARFGISSVISVMDDHLIEKMRCYHALNSGIHYTPITIHDDDHRAKRITTYLNRYHLRRIMSLQNIFSCFRKNLL